MVAGRGLLPLVLCHALFLLAEPSLAVNRLSPGSHQLLGRGGDPIASVSPFFSRVLRNRRSGSPRAGTGLRFASSNSSFEGTLMMMMEDEAIGGNNDGGGGLQEKLVVRGQVVILECLERELRPQKTPLVPLIKDTHSDAAVRWFHGDQEVKPDLRVTWSVTGRLRISHAISGDSGVWRCRKDGFFRRPLRLVVTIPPERPFLVYGGAQLAEGARLTTRAGNSLSLHCVVKGGNPAPSIEWFLNEKDMTDNSTIRSEWRGPEAQFESISNVSVSRVTKNHHNASVVCRVVHPALSRPHTAHLKLNIEYTPDFRLRRWPVWGSPLREGAAVALLCNVDANPPSLPYWIKEAGGKEEKVGSDGGWLNLTAVAPKSRGWYKCATKHPFGEFSSHSVFINVLHDGNSDGGPITQEHYPLSQKEPPPPHPPPEAVCPPQHEEKSDSNNKYIWKSDIKIKVMNRTHSALEGGPAMLTAHLCGTPPVAQDHVTWLPPSKTTPLSPGKSFGRWTAFNLSSRDSQECVLSNLHIVPVSAEGDAGAWIVLVANGHSAHAAVVRLNVSTAAAKSLAAAAADVTRDVGRGGVGDSTPGSLAEVVMTSVLLSATATTHWLLR